jgi:hypothetical protein
MKNAKFRKDLQLSPKKAMTKFTFPLSKELVKIFNLRRKRTVGGYFRPSSLGIRNFPQNKIIE